MNPSFNFNTPNSNIAATAPNTLSTLQKPETIENLNTVTTTTQSSATLPQQLNFCQLEEIINKWTHELEEQEKTFINQATEVIVEQNDILMVFFLN